MEHPGSQSLVVPPPAFPRLADLIVLAELAVQVAVGEQDGPRAMLAYERILFPEVTVVAGDHCLVSGAAGSALRALQAVDSALAPAEPTLFKHSTRLSDAPLKLACGQQIQVGCFELGHPRVLSPPIITDSQLLGDFRGRDRHRLRNNTPAPSSSARGGTT